MIDYFLLFTGVHNCNQTANAGKQRLRSLQRGTKHKDVPARHDGVSGAKRSGGPGGEGQGAKAGAATFEPVVADPKALPDHRRSDAVEHKNDTEGGQEHAQRESADSEEKKEGRGEESRPKGREDAFGDPAGVHRDVDAVQHPGAAETDHVVHRVHTAGALGLFLLPLLHQQYREPGLLRAL